MKTIKTDHNLTWVPYKHVCELIEIIPDEPMSIDPKLVTSVFCVGYYKGCLLLVLDKDRGWNTPGGHVEPGEDFLQALKREVWEEAQCHIKKSEILGCQRITLLEQAKPTYPYPIPTSFQMFYMCELEPDLYKQNNETMGRRFLALGALPKTNDLNPNLVTDLILARKP